ELVGALVSAFIARGVVVVLAPLTVTAALSAATRPPLPAILFIPIACTTIAAISALIVVTHLAFSLAECSVYRMVAHHCFENKMQQAAYRSAGAVRSPERALVIGPACDAVFDHA